MTACPDPIRLVAASVGADAAALAHATGCPACRRAMREHLALADVARELPAPRPLEPARVGSLAAAVLARAEDLVLLRPQSAMRVETSPRRGAITAGVAVLAIAAAVAVIAVVDVAPPAPARPAVTLASPPDPERVTAIAHLAPPAASPDVEPTARRHAASVIAAAGARFDRPRVGATDRIALRDGALTIEATPASAPVLLTGDNVRVRIRRARVVARASAGVVRQVQVFAGTVEVRTDAGAVVVSAGETWSWDDPDPDPDPGPAAANARLAAFNAAFDARRAGDFAGAAGLFERASADPRVGEEAAYMAALMWERAGEPARARAGLARFLARFPASVDADTARRDLARLDAKAGDTE